MPGSAPEPAQPGDDALPGLAVTLADLYEVLYGERPLVGQASLTDDMLAWVFEDGLTSADEGLLSRGQDTVVRRYRREFFEVAGEQMDEVVRALVGCPVKHSFSSFDPLARTTHVIFVLDLETPDFERRQALVGWSAQVRRNAARLRREHAATSEMSRELKERVRAQRERIAREKEMRRGRAG